MNVKRERYRGADRIVIEGENDASVQGAMQTLALLLAPDEAEAFSLALIKAARGTGRPCRQYTERARGKTPAAQNAFFGVDWRIESGPYTIRLSRRVQCLGHKWLPFEGIPNDVAIDLAFRVVEEAGLSAQERLEFRMRAEE